MVEYPFKVVDSRGLTDANWVDINRLRAAFEESGPAFEKALADLFADPLRYVAVMGSFFPEEMREAIKDEMAENGMTEEDLRDLARKLESPARDQ